MDVTINRVSSEGIRQLVPIVVDRVLLAKQGGLGHELFRPTDSDAHTYLAGVFK